MKTPLFSFTQVHLGNTVLQPSDFQLASDHNHYVAELACFPVGPTHHPELCDVVLVVGESLLPET